EVNLDLGSASRPRSRLDPATSAQRPPSRDRDCYPATFEPSTLTPARPRDLDL
ncbi:hypothetical protein CRG98_048659, partial [Punica granatum]